MLAPASVSDYRELARKRLPRLLFDYVDGGAFDESTLRANCADLQRLTLKQKVLRDVLVPEIDRLLVAQALRIPLGDQGLVYAVDDLNDLLIPLLREPVPTPAPATNVTLRQVSPATQTGDAG